MISSFISTASLSDGMRSALSKAQRQLAEAQLELSTGRYADVGRSLGSATSRTISIRRDMEDLQSLTDTNNILAPKLEFGQSVLESVARTADKFLQSAIAARGSSQGAHVAKVSSEDALKSLISAMNTTYDGQYLFAGINASQRPIADYFSIPAPSSKTAVDTAFVAQFGVPQTDPGISSLAAIDVESFLTGPFSALFDVTGWSSAWSSASNDNITSRISQSEVIETSVNANSDAIRNLGQAFTMVADLGIESMNDAAQEAILDKAIALTSDAISGLNSMRASLGVAQDRVSSTNRRISIQVDILSKSVAKLENVDPAEVAVRITTLSTQMEAAYALTARLSKMSLVNYL